SPLGASAGRRSLRSSRRRRGRRDRSRPPRAIAAGRPTAALVLLIAVGIDLGVGDPPNRWHPVAWIGRALGRGRAAFASGGPTRLLIAGALVTVGVAGLA